MFPAKLPLQKIVMVCIDGSEHSERAFNWYIDNIHRTGDEVGLIHIHVQPDTPSIGLFGGGLAALEGYKIEVERSIAKSKEAVEKYFRMCNEKGIHAKMHVHTKDQSIGHTIINIANQHNAVQVIMGSRGLTTLRRTFLGSVSDYVLHHTHIPVTVVPPPDTSHQHQHNEPEIIQETGVEVKAEV